MSRAWYCLSLALSAAQSPVVTIVTMGVSFGIRPSSTALLRRASRSAVQPAS
ncbi:MAG: hypothetical protein BWX79_03212 [Alphaproteobacteria bacterium ADurb.Bin100]|nr:MAG: hypothetical protein BWX79_03212 [Alphaproteobacteria bacterium ADurb.Bin100]